MVFSSNLFLYLFLPLFLAGYWLARGTEAEPLSSAASM